MTAQRTKSARLVITVRVMYQDGEVAYIAVTGTAVAQQAVVIAWQQAELERPDIPVSNADVAGVNEEDQCQPSE